MHGFFSAMTFALLRLADPASPRLVASADRDDPLPIVAGRVVPECAWPSVVVLYTEGNGRCSGVYVGGRVVLTAAHCIPSGYLVTDQACTSDAECPDVSALNGAVTLECDPSEFECRDPDPLITNKIVHAQFGSEYGHRTSLDGGLPRKSIGVAYCRQVANVPPGGMGGSPSDFGYCLLKEEPNVQVIPISTPCENEAELLTGTELVAVGFGESVDSEVMDMDSGGTKRWATATLADDQWAVQPSVLVETTLDWTSEGGVPVYLAGGDSGGPLFARMSDGSWRVIGIAQTPFAWGIPFHHINWLLGDPNVNHEDILPCHDAMGTFVGGDSCGATPTAPDMASGRWDRGVHACHTDAVLQMSNLCSPAMEGGSIEPRLTTPLPAQPPGLPSPSTASGCRVGSAPAPLSLASVPVLGLLLLRRGRRS
jgi:Trypsin-like peptidase domain